MNHDPTPTSLAASHPTLPRRDDEAAAAPSSSLGDDGGRQSDVPTPDTASRRSSLSKKAKDGLGKKLAFLTHLLGCLDTLIYAELCTLYYMECSFFRLFLRWLPQWTYLTPKPENIIFLLPNYQVSAIVGPNLLCMFLHIVTSLPQASEASRGYLHGGVLVDFVGQRPPTSKFTLILLDVVLLCLQCVMLSVNMERDKVRKIIKPPRSSTSNGRAGVSARPTTNQDHDAEERGVHRAAPAAGRPMGDGTARAPTAGATGSYEEQTTEAGNMTSQDQNSSYEELGDVLNSGNATLAEFHVRDALRTSWSDRLNTPESGAAFALQNVGYNATLAALAAQRNARRATARANRT
ncbi:DSC E3 ubiquitin ligase complex subunit 4 [Apiospora kogelbergensis]|uniref:DSC E3 ubiquitin ligase complex subunit 4 n=1 Tax=Apiospora kogelbergensis TaxID=1337665 RepID=A0AAW0QW74_9PEZI